MSPFNASALSATVALLVGAPALLAAQDARAPMGARILTELMTVNCPQQDGRAKTVDSIKADLGITEAQKGVWENFAVAPLKAKVGIQELQRSLESMTAAKSSADRLDARIRALELHLNAVREFRTPVEELYAALSAEQRTKADALLGDVTCIMWAEPTAAAGTH